MVVSFVTFNEGGEQGKPPSCMWGEGTTLSEVASGITIPYVEPGSLHKEYSMHFVRLSPLAERTHYSYKCKSARSDYSQVFQFKSLYYGGDGTVDTKIAIFVGFAKRHHQP